MIIPFPHAYMYRLYITFQFSRYNYAEWYHLYREDHLYNYVNEYISMNDNKNC